MGSNAPGVLEELVGRILADVGTAPQQWRQAAFDGTAFDSTAFDSTGFDTTGLDGDRLRGLVEKVATRPTEVTDGDFAAAAEAGVTDDQLWEVVICAAVGQAARQYQRAAAVLAAVREQER